MGKVSHLAQLDGGQTDILVNHKQEARIDSRLFADRVGIKHKNLYALIQKHKAELQQLGSLPFQTETSTRDIGATVAKYVPLNEAQFDYVMRVIRGRNPGRVNQLKLDVTKAFAKRRAFTPICHEYLPGYHESRDILKALGAKFYHYINLTNAENIAVGLVNGERENATGQQLAMLAVIHGIERVALTEALSNGMSASDAVRDVICRIKAFASLMNATPALVVSHV